MIIDLCFLKEFFCASIIHFCLALSNHPISFLYHYAGASILCNPLTHVILGVIESTFTFFQGKNIFCFNQQQCISKIDQCNGFTACRDSSDEEVCFQLEGKQMFSDNYNRPI